MERVAGAASLPSTPAVSLPESRPLGRQPAFWRGGLQQRASAGPLVAAGRRPCGWLRSGAPWLQASWAWQDGRQGRMAGHTGEPAQSQAAVPPRPQLPPPNPCPSAACTCLAAGRSPRSWQPLCSAGARRARPAACCAPPARRMQRSKWRQRPWRRAGAGSASRLLGCYMPSDETNCEALKPPSLRPMQDSGCGFLLGAGGAAAPAPQLA